MNRKGQTTGFKLSQYLEELSQFIGADIFDYVLVNNEPPPQALIQVYAEEGDLVRNDLKLDSAKPSQATFRRAGSDLLIQGGIRRP